LAELSGVILVDKPEGPTSHDMVALARRLLGTRRIGHAGTLDPLATGLLVLMIGKATRLAPFLSGADKTYRGILRLGFATDTYDRGGTPIGEPSEVNVERDTLLSAIDRFRGTIQQVPPVYSAKKVRGTPMYRLARRRKPVEPTPVTVTFRRIDLLGHQGDEVEIEAEVSAGTYLRSFAHDLGQALGCGAHLKTLRRVTSGPFLVADAYTPQALEEMRAEAAGRIIPLEEVPLGLPTLQLSAAGCHAIRHGRQCQIGEVLSPRLPLPPGRCRLQGPQGALIGIGEVQIQPPPTARPIIRPQIVFAP
jgi:tRNA pseudouridine55 synthase